MSGEDEPTTAAEMAILASLDDVLSEAHGDQFQALCIEMSGTVHEAKLRYLRGEMSEPERREWVRVIAETCPMIETFLENDRSDDGSRLLHFVASWRGDRSRGGWDVIVT